MISGGVEGLSRLLLSRVLHSTSHDWLQLLENREESTMEAFDITILVCLGGAVLDA